jgi:hypothetical protein
MSLNKALFQKKMRIPLNVAAAVLMFSSPALASKFANQFVEFELPPRWQCNLEGAEWVCQSADETRKRDAIIVLAAKLKGDQDSIDQYTNYLKAPKLYQSVQGRTVKSEAKYAKQLQINEHTWVDSLHLESELPGFYTRYLATVKQDIGVLVTFSINKDKYSQYQADAETMVNTLKVFRKAGGINAAPQGTSLFANTNIPANIESNSVFPTQPATSDSKARSEKQGEELPTGLLVLGAAVVLYLIWRRRQSED